MRGIVEEEVMKLQSMPNGRKDLPKGYAGGRQKGSVILEALIAILIFSVGILGLVGMQATAISSVSDAKYRADASFLADQLIGQMWASRVSTTIAGITTYAIDPTYAYPSGVSNTVVNAWAGQSGVQGLLPQGNAVVTIASQQATIVITWQPPKATTPHKHTAVAYIN
jgi:type IV pilus assembly protein PilV